MKAVRCAPALCGGKPNDLAAGTASHRLNFLAARHNGTENPPKDRESGGCQLSPDSPDEMGRQGRKPRKRRRNCRFLLSPVASVRTRSPDPAYVLDLMTEIGALRWSEAISSGESGLRTVLEDVSSTLGI